VGFLPLSLYLSVSLSVCLFLSILSLSLFLSVLSLSLPLFRSTFLHHVCPELFRGNGSEPRDEVGRGGQEEDHELGETGGERKKKEEEEGENEGGRGRRRRRKTKMRGDGGRRKRR
jgi:hypothetical protein